jgi:hypothetical protein
VPGFDPGFPVPGFVLPPGELFGVLLPGVVGVPLGFVPGFGLFGFVLGGCVVLFGVFGLVGFDPG